MLAGLNSSIPFVASLESAPLAIGNQVDLELQVGFNKEHKPSITNFSPGVADFVFHSGGCFLHQKSPVELLPEAAAEALLPEQLGFDLFRLDDLPGIYLVFTWKLPGIYLIAYCHTSHFLIG